MTLRPQSVPMVEIQKKLVVGGDEARSPGAVGIEMLASGALGRRLVTWAQLAAREHGRVVDGHGLVKPGVAGRIGRSLWDDFGHASSASQRGPAA